MIGLLLFLTTITFFAFICSVIINGFYKATRGHWKRKPDGRRVKSGYILKGWYFFWYQESGTRTIPYEGGELIQMVRAFRQNTGIETFELDYPNNPRSFYTIPEFDAHRLVIESTMGVKIKHDYDSGKLHCWVQQEEPMYRFPCWIREVLAGCITCFSSFYGTLLFCIFHFMLWDDIVVELYSPFKSLKLAVFFCWMGFVLALAYVNTLLNKKLN